MPMHRDDCARTFVNGHGIQRSSEAARQHPDAFPLPLLPRQHGCVHLCVNIFIRIGAAGLQHDPPASARLHLPEH